HFEAVYEAYLGDAEVRGFLEAHNPDALGEMAERLGEAIDRGQWRPKRNSLRDKLNDLARTR
ncbi:MAG TPA: cobaltochelatase subunit CobN, partial [Stellaceae bacterium]|nr:cobaltochelatase subunit CobN [Stellaceae bacterium]